MSVTEVAPLTPQEVASTLAASIINKRKERLEQETNKPAWKPRRHYASGLNGCARQMVYAMTNWQEKEPFSIDGMAAMQDGNHEEKLMLAELSADGFDVVEQQVQLDDDRYFVTGKIDGKIRWQGRRVPFEMKRMKPFVFDKIDSVQDFKEDSFLMKYLRQLTLYLYLHSEEAGLFILSDGLGRRKVIVVPLDLEVAESILKDLDRANASLKRMEQGVSVSGGDVLPPRIPYHSKTCGYCSFKRTCLPDMNFGEGAVLGDTELQNAIKRYTDLKPVASEFEQTKKAIKTTVEGKPLVVAGNYLVTGEWKERKMPSQPERVDKFWKWDVESKANTNGAA